MFLTSNVPVSFGLTLDTLCTYGQAGARMSRHVDLHGRGASGIGL